MKKLVLVFGLMFGIASTYAQTEEELKAEQAPKTAEIAKLQAEVDALQAKIDALPGWKIGAFGTIGANLQGFNDWYTNAAPNSSTGNIGVTANVFANLLEEKFFWRNSLGANLAWVKNDNTDIDTDSDDFDATTDVFTLTSLYGRKLNEKWAVSGLAEYRTTLLNNFNDPGYLDLGVGATWTPMSNLVVVIHPLNYNFVFSSTDAFSFESSLGAKIVADYNQKFGAVSYKSNLSAFLSYEDGDYSNWTWVNSLGYTLWKGIGIGAELGLRGNKQEAFNSTGAASLSETDNNVQSYWLFGLNYAF